jgi:hypothetical protein
VAGQYFPESELAVLHLSDWRRIPIEHELEPFGKIRNSIPQLRDGIREQMGAQGALRFWRDRIVIRGLGGGAGCFSGTIEHSPPLPCCDTRGICGSKSFPNSRAGSNTHGHADSVTAQKGESEAYVRAASDGGDDLARYL